MTNFEYEKNIEKLIIWAKAYYVYDEPLASDEEYDKLARECLEFEKNNPNLTHPNSPNKRVGGYILEGFSKASHLSRMWSQEDVFNTKELEDWIKRASKVENNLEFFIQPKFVAKIADNSNCYYAKQRIDIIQKQKIKTVTKHPLCLHKAGTEHIYATHQQ